MLPAGVGSESGVFTAIVNIKTRDVRPTAASTQWPSERIKKKPVLEVRVVQDMNSAPELEARVRGVRRARVITNLNPQFLEREMGRVHTFTWTDRHARALSGGIVL